MLGISDQGLMPLNKHTAATALQSEKTAMIISQAASRTKKAPANMSKTQRPIIVAAFLPPLFFTSPTLSN
jgi:hypothetical protein